MKLKSKLEVFMKEIIRTDNAPQPIGPYSQAVIGEGKMLFISGQIPLTPEGSLAGDDITSQTKQVCENIKAVLAEAGLTLNNVVKTTVMMKDITTFADMNAIYNEYFGESKPARAAFEAVRLPKDVLLMIDAIAVF